MNALSGDTYLFAEIDGKYGVYTLKELFELHKQGRAIKVPTLLNERGEKTWVEVEDVVSFGEQSLKRITLSTTRLYVELSENTIIPAFGSHLFEGTEEQINLKFKLANELKVTQDLRHNNTLLLTTHIPLELSEGNQFDFELGFAVGFFISEGNLEYRKRKNTKQSLAQLTALARKKGMTLQEYEKFATDVRRVHLTIGQSDFERGYIDILQKHFKMSKPCKKKNANSYYLYFPDLSFIRLIKDYMEGHDSHTKRLKNEVYNNSRKFLEGIMDGYLAGDGYYKKGKDFGSFYVNMTTNYLLYNDLIFLSKALGYDIHLWKPIYKKGGFKNGKFYWELGLSIFKTYHRRTALGLLKEHIKKIEDAGEREAFNLVLKPLYSENDKRAKFNHLYFTAFGILVSDAVKVLDRSSLTTPLALPLLQK